MIVKPTGRTVISATGEINYLGTSDDKTHSHQNPGLKKYREARQKYNQTGLNKYHQQMMKYKVYTHRDLITFGNFDTSSTKVIKAQIKKFMSHNSRKVQSREFVIMPSDTDKVNPNDPESVQRFANFVHRYIEIHFKDNFHYYAVVQPDSHTNSRVHAHVVVVNDNLVTHKAMAGHYYNINGKHGLWSDLKRVTSDSGYTVPDPTIKPHTPTRMEEPVISKAREVFQALQADPNEARKITSQSKLTSYMARYGLIAKYRNTVRHYKGTSYRVKGWKFKLDDGKRHAYIKASRLSRATGAEFLSTNNIAETLSKNRKLNARMKRQSSPQQPAIASNIASNSVEPQSSSSIPVRRKPSVSASIEQSADDEPAPSFSMSKPSSSSSDESTASSIASVAAEKSKTDERAREAQQSATAQRQQQLIIKREEVKKAKQRKERANDERRRISEKYAREYQELSKQSNQEFKGLAKEAKRPHSVATRTSERVEEEHIRRGKPSHVTTVASVISGVRKAIKDVKRFQVQRHIERLEHRIASRIAKQIKGLYREARQRVREQIARRNANRKAKREKKVTKQNRKHEEHEEEEGISR